jgi:hypothetical protein
MGGSADHAPDDIAWMARAVALAERARDLAGDNPHVGCVLVRDGHWLADGWTQPPGGMHAEAMALAAVGGCTGGDRVRDAGTVRSPWDGRRRARRRWSLRGVPGGRGDGPTPTTWPREGSHRPGRRRGGRDAGCAPSGWVRAQLASWLTVVTHGRPHVTLKLAQTVDGALANPDGPVDHHLGVAPRRAPHAWAMRTRCWSGPARCWPTTPAWTSATLPCGRHSPGRRAGRPWPHTRPTPASSGPARSSSPHPARPTGDQPWLPPVSGSWRCLRIARRRRGPAGGAGRPAHRVRNPPGPGRAGSTLAGALLEADLVDRVVRHVATSVRGADGQSRIVAVLAPTATWPITQQVVRGPDLEIVSDRPAG